jgi:hypothetical protein
MPESSARRRGVWENALTVHGCDTNGLVADGVSLDTPANRRLVDTAVLLISIVCNVVLLHVAEQVLD